MSNNVVEQPASFTRPLEAAPGKFIVLMRGDRLDNGEKGRYVVSNKTFPTFGEAKFYAEGCSASREPVVAVLVELAVGKP